MWWRSRECMLQRVDRLLLERKGHRMLQAVSAVLGATSKAQAAGMHSLTTCILSTAVLVP